MADLDLRQLRAGATCLEGGRGRFVVWAPQASRVEIHLVAPEERLLPMEKGPRGYHHALVEGVWPGALYLYRLDGRKERPDPASRFQPRDVHGPSQLVESTFAWGDGCWFGLPLRDYLLYELHVGTFTPEGTFDAAIPHLDYLKQLGITAVELMPVAQFPGDRNWGYDGVYPYAVQNSYGGPDGLKRLVDACHHRGLCVVLDVVYNHLGPEGNYFADFGPYFTDRYRTPWGPAVNFDGPGSDEVRRYFQENALYWLTEFHVDALRVDAVHAIYDRSARPFLQELAEAVHSRGEQLNRRLYVIAESDLDDARLILPPELGGLGLDAQWNDDFHHALSVLLTGERNGYYRDFSTVDHLARAFREGYVYTGQFSQYRNRRHGNSSRLCKAQQFVVFSRNHDQIGNRMLGERPSQLLSFEALKLAAGAVLLSPFIPLLFMGEEYGETAPFQYFISHLDPRLVEAVRRGRREEFSGFAWSGEPPDPQDIATFNRAKLDHELRNHGHHRVLLDFYRELFRLRREVPSLASLSKEQLDATGWEKPRLLLLRRWAEGGQIALLFHFDDVPETVSLPLPLGRWHRLLDSSEERWGGAGSLLPAEIESDGEVRLTIGPTSLLLIRRREDDGRFT